MDARYPAFVLCLLLASDAAKNITGCMFPVDGGTMPY